MSYLMKYSECSPEIMASYLFAEINCSVMWKPLDEYNYELIVVANDDYTIEKASRIVDSFGAEWSDEDYE